MPAYIIVEIDLKDPEPYEEYKRLAPPTMTAFGGRYLVRGGAVQVLEGDWSPKRVVVLEFPDAKAARAWYESEEYDRIKPIRQATTDTRMIVVEGLTSPI